jgi:pimeloyl-ACP methyl ester carboxylesterase/predicted amino acid-binding ACT domain protein
MVMATPVRGTDAVLERRRLEVQGRRASCAVGGQGLPVVFLHGWGLSYRAYQDALRALMARGCRVYAPALPGFGGTANLPAGARTFAGYAAWVDAFLDAVDLHEPALVVGHSFGGGVAIRLAHDAPKRVRHLVLINSVGSPAGSNGPTLAAQPYDRPVWQYGLQFAKEFWSRDGYHLVQAIREDLVRNTFANPWTLTEIGTLARRADLTVELAALRRREVPILVLWSDGDGVLPLAAFEALCAAIGTDGRVLKGGHSWLLAKPLAFSEVLDNLVQVQIADHESTGIRTTMTELRSLLRRTTIPMAVVTRLLTDASPLWMMSERPAVLAADLTLCHPALVDGEVRAVARPMEDPRVFRLTVVAADRPGLLADTAAALADEGLSVLSASVATWSDRNIALHSLTCTSTTAAVPDWDALGVRLRSIGTTPRSAPRYRPTGRASVAITGSRPGQSVVKVTAPDGIGLLEAISRWLAERDLNIEAAEITTRTGVASDRFLVDGEFDPSALASHLSRSPTSPWNRLPLSLSLPRCRLFGRT